MPFRPFVAGSLTDIRQSSVIVKPSVVTAASLLSQRPGYVKAFVVHGRGFQNHNHCAGCERGYREPRDYPGYLGCVSLPGYYDNACSNCLRTDRACSLKFNTPPPYKDLTRAEYGKKDMWKNPNQMTGRPQAHGG